MCIHVLFTCITAVSFFGDFESLSTTNFGSESPSLYSFTRFSFSSCIPFSQSDLRKRDVGMRERDYFNYIIVQTYHIQLHYRRHAT